MSKKIIRFGLRVENSEVWAKLTKKAKENHRSINAELNRLIEQYVKE